MEHIDACVILYASVFNIRKCMTMNALIDVIDTNVVAGYRIA